jgi:alpha-L-arabinofuranosidase
MVLLSLGQNLNAAELHVKPNGDDSNPGSEDAPLRTIQHAAELAQPGDVVLIHDGVYRERIAPPRGGLSEDRRIVFKAFPGAKPVIKGSERITNWVHQSAGVWKVDLNAPFFGVFNPYTASVNCGRWLDYGKWHHRGDVFLDGVGLLELEKQSEVAAKTNSWFTRTTNSITSIWVNFGAADPNRALAEINVRDACFAPNKLELNYLTLDGLTFQHAATYWAGPDCPDQTGAVCTKTGNHWIIEHCVVCDSRCCGISIGQWTGGIQSLNSGHHIIRNNQIRRCGETAIVGSRYNFGSLIERNLVEDINHRNEFGGGETAGIKLHHAVDVVIRQNLIRRVRGDSGNFGLWMDWAWQNARVSGNVFVDIQGPALYIECSWGPNLIDHNVFIGNGVSQTASQSALFVHNLFWNAPIARSEDMSRSPQYWIPHTVTQSGSGAVKTSRDGWYNNIFIREGLSRVKGGDFHADYNIYLEGAKKSPIENHSLETFSNTKLAWKSDASGVSVSFTMDESPWKMCAPFISSVKFGEMAGSGQRIENLAGSPVSLNEDFFGNPHPFAAVLSGPFEKLKQGTNRFDLFEVIRNP